jgi:hypothetical protein
MVRDIPKSAAAHFGQRCQCAGANFCAAVFAGRHHETSFIRRLQPSLDVMRAGGPLAQRSLASIQLDRHSPRPPRPRSYADVLVSADGAPSLTRRSIRAESGSLRPRESAFSGFRRLILRGTMWRGTHRVCSRRLSPPRKPKKRGPFQLVPVILRAMVEGSQKPVPASRSRPGRPEPREACLDIPGR